MLPTLFVCYLIRAIDYAEFDSLLIISRKATYYETRPFTPSVSAVVPEEFRCVGRDKFLGCSIVGVERPESKSTARCLCRDL